MSDNISGSEWRKALTSILEELDESEYKKMLFCPCFDKIPKSVKTGRSREEMPHIIIKYLGVDESISAVAEAMDLIPRKDPAVQDLLRPFVDKLRKKREEENRESMKENREIAPENQRVMMTPLAETKGKKRKHDSDWKSADEEPKPKTNQLKSSQPDKERKIPTWRKTIKDVLTSGDLGNKTITGKVVQKSALRTYETQQKEKKFFFYLGVSDEESCIKVMVYGKDRYQDIQEGRYYSFRNVIMEENVMKVTKQSKVARTSPIDVPEELELEAEMLIYPQKPVCSIAKAKEYADKTVVSVEGTVTEIGHVEPIKVKNQWRKKDKQEFQLKDGKDSIRITLWGKDTAQLGGTSDGDFVRVTNVKTSHYYETVSLNSTDFTRIYKIQSAAMQNVTIEIIGIMNANMTETQLEASFNDQVETFVVSSELLAKVFDVRLDSDFEDKLIEKIPLSANVEIKGSTINAITAAKEI
ncbi:uncharacterized protein [Thunnus thynnus]|uniref:uncharacterized protein isoform X3 n=1 Tax=Thunnus thynnus TaxID=8237 RepID=UPI003528133D